MIKSVVLLMPASDHGVGRRYHDVLHPLSAWNALSERRRSQPDSRAELENVDGAEHLPEQAGDPTGRVDLSGEDLKQGRLAGTVGADHDPAVGLVNPPGDIVD